MIVKRFLSILLSGITALGFGALAPVRVSAESEDPEEINLLNRGEWSDLATEGNVEWSKDGVSLSPNGLIGTTYATQTMGEGTINFTYHLETRVDLTDEEDVGVFPSFFGLLFSNARTDVDPYTHNDVCIPWSWSGGYPYMLCFDQEIQDLQGADQMGLTLRRYKYSGSHDFTRWATVNPREVVYVNNAGAEYENKVPAFYKPVGIGQCYDENEHSVSLKVENLYKEQGDEYDAVRINVWFDGDLCLTVIDEMPFEGEDFGEIVEIDKRQSEGWISLYVYGSYFTMNVTSMTAIFESGSVRNNVSSASGGCGSVFSRSGNVLLIVLPVAYGAYCFVLKKKKRND